MESLIAFTNYCLLYLPSWSNPTDQPNNLTMTNCNIHITNNSGFKMVLHEAYGKYGVYVSRPVNIPIGGTCTFEMRPDSNRRWPLLSTSLPPSFLPSSFLPADLCKSAENGAEGIVQYFVQNGPQTLLSLNFTCNDANINICRMVSVPTGAFICNYDVDELTIEQQNPLLGQWNSSFDHDPSNEEPY